MLDKLLVKLLCYNYIIKYKKGNKNRVANALLEFSTNCTLSASTAKPSWNTEVVAS